MGACCSSQIRALARKTLLLFPLRRPLCSAFLRCLWRFQCLLPLPKRRRLELTRAISLRAPCCKCSQVRQTPWQTKARRKSTAWRSIRTPACATRFGRISFPRDATRGYCVKLLAGRVERLLNRRMGQSRDRCRWSSNRKSSAIPGLMYPVEDLECRGVKTRLASEGRAGRGAEAPLYHLQADRYSA
jgi:hypothetical protein